MRVSNIYTLGTSNRTVAQFVGLLRRHGIEVVIDVRSFPTSRFEHFKKENLSKELKEENIDYTHLKELGGFRKGGYKSYMNTTDFKKGLEKLEEIASNKRAAVVCAEKLPWRCHRRHITYELSRRGWYVEHIIDEKKTGFLKNKWL